MPKEGNTFLHAGDWDNRHLPLDILADFEYIKYTGTLSRTPQVGEAQCGEAMLKLNDYLASGKTWSAFAAEGAQVEDAIFHWFMNRNRFKLQADLLQVNEPELLEGIRSFPTFTFVDGRWTYVGLCPMGSRQPHRLMGGEVFEGLKACAA